jgi:hypothetical protein
VDRRVFDRALEIATLSGMNITGGVSRALAVKPIPIRANLVDTEETLTLDMIRGIKADGNHGIIAYLGGNLTPELIENCASENMGLVPVNFSRAAGWTPTANLGEIDAMASLRRLAMLGLPTVGLNDWCDLEGCSSDPTEYCKAWCGVELGSTTGIVPASYGGAEMMLTGRQWFLLPFRGYWHGDSRRVPEPDCGFQLIQLFPPNQHVAGAQVDYTIAQRDWEGRAPTWIVPA